ncbi:30S ribosomal protein S19e [Candidatus Woesearchaeota archaeon]|nr:30S ribosomal protein S19e [Candidatus Woesearchaeota archaeon]
MTRVYNTEAKVIVDKAAEELKKQIKQPEWAKFVKTGVAKDRPPAEQDWWYKRAASILRRIYIRGPLGTNKLRQKYSSKKNRGYKPEKTYKAGGKIIRTILQQLETAQLIKKEEKKSHKGRIITPRGKSFLDKLSK